MSPVNPQVPFKGTYEELLYLKNLGLAQLADLTLTDPTNGDTIVFEDGVWINVPDPVVEFDGGTVANATEFLSDVSVDGTFTSTHASSHEAGGDDAITNVATFSVLGTGLTVGAFDDAFGEVLIVTRGTGGNHSLIGGGDAGAGTGGAVTIRGGYSEEGAGGNVEIFGGATGSGTPGTIRLLDGSSVSLVEITASGVTAFPPLLVPLTLTDGFEDRAVLSQDGSGLTLYDAEGDTRLEITDGNTGIKVRDGDGVQRIQISTVLDGAGSSGVEFRAVDFGLMGQWAPGNGDIIVADPSTGGSVAQLYNDGGVGELILQSDAGTVQRVTLAAGGDGLTLYDAAGVLAASFGDNDFGPSVKLYDVGDADVRVEMYPFGLSFYDADAHARVDCKSDGTGLILYDVGSNPVANIAETYVQFYGAAGLAAASRPAVPTQVVAVDVDDFNAIRTAMIALGIWTDGD